MLVSSQSIKTTQFFLVCFKCLKGLCGNSYNNEFSGKNEMLLTHEQLMVLDTTK